MRSFIELENMKFFANHGVLKQEKKIGNEYVVTLRVKFDLSMALISDKLPSTINYAEVYEVIKKEISIHSELIEYVAGRILRAIHLNWPQIEEINLKLSKLNPPINGEIDKASVILNWERRV